MEGTQKIFEFRGVDNLYIAELTADTEAECEYGTPIHLSPVAEIGKTTETSSEAHYYDNIPMMVIDSEGSDKISIVMAPPELEKLAQITGKSFDATTGMMVDGERQTRYFAVMYRTKGTDGKYRYVVRSKGTFSIPEDSHATENEGTDTTNTSVEFTGIYTTHKFNKGKFVNGKWEKGPVKGIVVDERYALTDLSTFFDKVQTPDTIEAKTQ